MMKNQLLIKLSIVLTCLSGGMQFAEAQVDKGTLWRDSVITELDVDFGNTGFHARWRYHRCHCGDLQVKVEQTAPDGIFTGELLMVDGQALLARGFEQQGDDIEPLIQAPSLMLQLAFELLNRSHPEGPNSIDDKLFWDKEEAKRDFKLNTGLASGSFSAPWSVKGSGWRTEAGHRRFEFLFTFSNPTADDPEGTDSITFSGDLDFRKQGFPYVDSASLEGWRIQWLSLAERESKPTPDDLTLEKLRQQALNP
jgi:hypothetical protein